MGEDVYEEFVALHSNASCGRKATGTTTRRGVHRNATGKHRASQIFLERVIHYSAESVAQIRAAFLALSYRGSESISPVFSFPTPSARFRLNFRPGMLDDFVVVTITRPGPLSVRLKPDPRGLVILNNFDSLPDDPHTSCPRLGPLESVGNVMPGDALVSFCCFGFSAFVRTNA